MARISFLNLAVTNKLGSQYTVEMSFKIGELTQPYYLGSSNVKLMYKIYEGGTCAAVINPGSAECKGTLIDYLPQGFTSQPTTFNEEIDDQYFNSSKRSRITNSIFTHFTTESNNVLVQAYLVGAGQPRYVTGTATGNIEYEQFSNITEQTLRLTGTAYGTGFDRTRGQQTTAPKPIVISGTKPFEKPERVSIFQPAKRLSQNTENIIKGIESGSIIIPSWFENNVTWVKSGQITETEFVNAYNFLSQPAPEVTIAPIPEITIPSIPEVSAEMQLITTNFQVIIKDVTRYTTSLSNADYKRLEDEMTLENRVSLVFLNQTDMKPLTTFYTELRKIQKLLEGQIVETVTISPTGQVITEPVTTGKPGLMGAGVIGLIGILILGGFISDHVRKRK